jgi:hypothetical protein
MNMNVRRFLVTSLTATLACVALAACSNKPSAEIQPAQPSSESFVNAGEYEMHYNAVRTDQLTPEIARAYGIERSKNKVLLNVSILNHANGQSTAMDATVTVLARNLSNQVKDLQLRRITEGTAIYYIGEVDIGNGSETLVFEINAIPIGSTNTITAKMTREFFAD